MRLESLRNPGVQAALLSAVLFGASTPLAKLLLGDASPWMLAGLLYLGSGLGLGAYRMVRRLPRVRIPRRERMPLAGAIVSGGIVAPVLLMLGLSGMPASGASLLLNLEGVCTAVLAWVVFRENVDRRVLMGMIAIVAGAVVLSGNGAASFADVWPSLAVVGACMAWGLDNNLTRKVALNDATWLAAVKGLVAGPLMGVGVWLHLTERHVHEHTHEPLTHDHWHTHDDGHHDHAHEPPVAVGTRHRHSHAHGAITHAHPHYPDSHHRHH